MLSCLRLLPGRILNSRNFELLEDVPGTVRIGPDSSAEGKRFSSQAFPSNLNFYPRGNENTFGENLYLLQPPALCDYSRPVSSNKFLEVPIPFARSWKDKRFNRPLLLTHVFQHVPGNLRVEQET